MRVSTTCDANATMLNPSIAVLYATVSASFVIEQYGLPPVGPGALWNGDNPERRVKELQSRYRDIMTE
jgi:hypothetical protein